MERESAQKNCKLQEFFAGLVESRFYQVGVVDRDIARYVAEMLTEFADVNNLYRIRGANNKPLQDVGEMLLESDPVFGPAPNFDREREVRKHIGDYTLFFTGMFPESINHARLHRHRLENLIDFIKAGKESYHIVAQFKMYEYEYEADLFEKLSHTFERCVFGLNQVRQELDVMQHPITRIPEQQRLLM
jgi:hypothetical protein